MNSDVKAAMLRAGIVPKNVLPELERWGLKLPEGVSVEEDLRSVLDNIREAVEGKKMVELRMTDLDALKIYAQLNKTGRLYYSLPDPTKLDPRARKTTFIEVSYAVMTGGVYLIPWTDEDIYDLMLDEGTYLKPVGEERVYFADISDLYYGEQKAFMVCTPTSEEKST